MSSKVSHSIKKRDSANDVFITPLPLAEKAIEMCMSYKGTHTGYVRWDAIWYDPFKNSGSYYNQFPTSNKVYSEILEGKDFFEFNDRNNVDIICSNPPYSILDKVLEHSAKLKPYIINYLIGVGNLTPRRIEMMEQLGYVITDLHMCKVYDWYGMSFIVQWERYRHPIDECVGKSIISYDRKVWKQEKPVKMIKIKKKKRKTK